MKKTFENLSEQKKGRIISACIDEFCENGYEKSTTESIIKKAGISKGGLYEYTESKKDLYIFIVKHTYEKLYNYLRNKVGENYKTLPPDILDRFKIISDIAIDFYIDHPEYVKMIVKTYKIHDVELEKEVRNIFNTQFMTIFGDFNAENLRHDRDRVFDLLMWLLLKTRYDFLVEFEYVNDPGALKNDYIDNWDFFLDVLRNGIYRYRT